MAIHVFILCLAVSYHFLEWNPEIVTHGRSHDLNIVTSESWRACVSDVMHWHLDKIKRPRAMLNYTSRVTLNNCDERQQTRHTRFDISKWKVSASKWRHLSNKSDNFCGKYSIKHRINKILHGSEWVTIFLSLGIVVGGENHSWPAVPRDLPHQQRSLVREKS